MALGGAAWGLWFPVLYTLCFLLYFPPLDQLFVLLHYPFLVPVVFIIEMLYISIRERGGERDKRRRGGSRKGREGE